MKKGTSFSKIERRTITLGYLWNYGFWLIPFLTWIGAFLICGLIDTTAEVAKRISFLFFGIALIFVGLYDIIGTVLEFKHIHISAQLGDKFRSPNPRRLWTNEEKKNYIFIGSIWAIIGLICIIACVLDKFGITTL